MINKRYKKETSKMFVDINYPFAEKLYSFYEQNDSVGAFKEFVNLFHSFKSIDSHEKLIKFCSFLKIDPDTLHEKSFPFSSFSEKNQMFMSFVGLAFITQNDFMVDYFKQFYENIYSDAIYINMIREEGLTNAIPLSTDQYYILSFHEFMHNPQRGIFSQIIPQRDIALNIFNHYYNDLADDDSLLTVIISDYFFNNSDMLNKDNKALIDFIRLSQLKSKFLPQNIKNKFIDRSYSLIKTEITFPLMLEAFKIDPLKEHRMLSLFLDDLRLSKKYIHKMGLRNFAIEYQTMVRKEVSYDMPLLETIFMKNSENFHRNTTTGISNGIEWLRFLHEKNEIHDILKEKPDFLSVALMQSVEPDDLDLTDSQRVAFKKYLHDFIKTLETHYDFKFVGYYTKDNNNPDSDKIYHNINNGNKTNPFLIDYVIQNNLSFMSSEDLKKFTLHLLKCDLYADIKNIFSIKHSHDKNDLFLMVLKAFKPNSQITGKQSKAQFCELFIMLLGPDFIKRAGIQVKPSEIIDIISERATRKTIPELSAFLSRYILSHTLNVQSGHVEQKLTQRL